MWSNAEVRAAAAAGFVCAADEVWRLQRGSEADSVFFQRAVTGGERITDRGSRQGTWIFSPGGDVLARTNTRNADAVLASFEKALAAWRELPDERRRLPADAGLEPEHRWELSRPADGLILERIGREVDDAGLEGEQGGRWNRDFAWFSREEVRALEPGARWDDLARRLARFHLVDNVRGQTLPFADVEIAVAELATRVANRDGRRVSIELEGRTRAVAEGPWLLGESLWTPKREHPRTIECALRGRATYDLESRSFEHFELVAVGRRQGRTTMNGRGREDPEQASLVAFHLRLAPDPEATVAPTFIELYDADWVARPAVPTWRDSPAEVGLARD